MASLPYEINYGPVLFRLLNLIVFKCRQLRPTQSKAEQKTKHCGVSLAAESVRLSDIKELLTLLQC